MAKRTTGLLYLLVLWVLISVLAWPAYVLSATSISYFGAEGWQLDAWKQIPKREMLRYFLEGYTKSWIVTVPIGFVAVADYLLLSRYRVTWILGGILLPLAGTSIAFTLYQQPMTALPTLALTGLLLAIAHRLVDVLAGGASRGRLP